MTSLRILCGLGALVSGTAGAGVSLPAVGNYVEQTGTECIRVVSVDPAHRQFQLKQYGTVSNCLQSIRYVGKVGRMEASYRCVHENAGAPGVWGSLQGSQAFSVDGNTQFEFTDGVLTGERAMRLATPALYQPDAARTCATRPQSAGGLAEAD